MELCALANAQLVLGFIAMAIRAPRLGEIHSVVPNRTVIQSVKVLLLWPRTACCNFVFMYWFVAVHVELYLQQVLRQGRPDR